MTKNSGGVKQMGTPDTGKNKALRYAYRNNQECQQPNELWEYAKVTGLDKEFIFAILNGEIEEVDRETWNRLSLKNWPELNANEKIFFDLSAIKTLK